MIDKRISRIRRGKKNRILMRESGKNRATVYRSGQHLYGQIVTQDGQTSTVIAQASTVDKELQNSLKGSKSEQASIVGRALAERAKAKGVSRIVFDRAGFKYHGRVKAFAEALRESGMEF